LKEIVGRELRVDTCQRQVSGGSRWLRTILLALFAIPFRKFPPPPQKEIVVGSTIPSTICCHQNDIFL